MYRSFGIVYLEITLIYTKPSEQTIFCHVTDVKMLRFFNRRKLARLIKQYRDIFSNIWEGTAFLLQGVTEKRFFYREEFFSSLNTDTNGL